MRIHRNAIEKVVIFTTTSNFEWLYDFLVAEGNDCCVVIPENRLGVQKIKDVQKLCGEKGIEIKVHPREAKELEGFHQWLVEGGYTFAVSWNYSQILKKETLSIFSNGVWNMHGGKIPEYRGGNVLQWALVNGEKEAGVTWHLMEEKIDHGLILKEAVVLIEEEDTALEVSQKISHKGLELFRRLWEEAGQGGVLPYAVDMTKGHYWKAREPMDGIIHSDMTKENIRNLLRAQCPPWPAPFVVHEGEVFRVLGIVEEPGTDVIAYINQYCRLLLKVSLEKDQCLVREVLEREKRK